MADETISLLTLKALVEKKMNKKILVKIIWNDDEKLTLFITPNLKVNSFIYDEKEGYLFYDLEGKQIEQIIPCILTEKQLINGSIQWKEIIDGKLKIINQSLSKEDMDFLQR